MFGIHVALAKLSECPELELSQDDSKLLAKSLADLSVHYPGARAMIDSKMMDHIAFGSVVFGMYAPRVTAIMLRKRNAAKTARESSPNVFPFSQTHTGVPPAS